ncbi:MAG: RrF2 family transcriptional regulator [Bacteroidota bacterium]
MAKLFNISEATIIAFHSLAMMDNDMLVSAEKVSVSTGASKNHVLKVLNTLTRQGYVKSIRGPKGGFRLNKNPRDIKLLEVFEMLEGPVSPSPCGLSKTQCPFKSCVFGDITFQLTEMFVDFLRDKTVKELSEINLKQFAN